MSDIVFYKELLTRAIYAAWRNTASKRLLRP